MLAEAGSRPGDDGNRAVAPKMYVSALNEIEDRSVDHSLAVTDAELIAELQQGRRECFSMLHNRYSRLIYQVAYRVLRDSGEAADLVQDVFVDIFLGKSQYDASRSSVKTWLLQYARFRSLTRRRYLCRRKFYHLDELGCTHQALEQKDNSPVEALQLIERAFLALNEHQREVIEMVHLEGYSLKESAHRRGVTYGTTRHHYYRGLKKMRSVLLDWESPRAR